jgi:polyhydroxyalkanoate synthesis regulator phasin
VSIWQSAFTMAEDEVDRLVNMLVKNKEISKSEAKRLRNEIVGYTDSVKDWIADSVDKRINEALGVMNLATKEEISTLNKKISALEKKMKKYERYEKSKSGKKTGGKK